jgi:predicted SprT family Zn-dependent metalloprotease
LALPSWIHGSMARWASVWGVPGLASQVTVEISPRMTRGLGRCYPGHRLIRISARLLQGPRSVLQEVLCHEFAHIAVHELNGSKSGPHGPAWTQLMRVAGFEPRTRLHCECDEPSLCKREKRQTYLHVHHCPVCQMERVARHPVKRWRCRACVEAGLDGKLEIHRRPAPGTQ